MDIDMNIGLAKPKIALAEVLLPATPDAESLDFSLLLDDTPPDSKDFSEAPPVPTFGATVPLQLPQAEVPEATVEQEIELELRAEPEPKIAQDKEDIPKALAHPIAEFPEIPTKRQADLPILAHPIAVATVTPPTAPAPIMPVQVANITPLTAPLLEGPRATPVPLQAPDSTPVLATPTAANPLPAPSAPLAPLLPVTLDKAGNTAPIQTADEPKITLNAQPSPPVEKASAQPQPQTQPLPSVGFTNIETIKDDPAEVQFSIKIDRQVAVDAPISRSTTPTPPVANQISTQLPQLITKAEKQTIELRLDPPELGRVTIHLTTHDQHVTAQVIADRPDTVDLMRRHAELLTAALARAGFSQADLSFQHGQNQGGKEGFSQFQTAALLAEGEEPTLPTLPSVSLDGRLDIRL